MMLKKVPQQMLKKEFLQILRRIKAKLSLINKKVNQELTQDQLTRLLTKKMVSKIKNRSLQQVKKVKIRNNQLLQWLINKKTKKKQFLHWPKKIKKKVHQKVWIKVWVVLQVKNQAIRIWNNHNWRVRIRQARQKQIKNQLSKNHLRVILISILSKFQFRSSFIIKRSHRQLLLKNSSMVLSALLSLMLHQSVDIQQSIMNN